MRDSYLYPLLPAPGAALVARPATGATDFDRRVDPHLERMRRAARRILGCDHLAADAVQDTLLALWREAAPAGDLRGWLVRAVVHRSLHLRRTLLRRVRHEMRGGCCELECGNPLHHAYAHELGEQIESAIERLPPPQREVFVLFEREGRDYAEIAQRLSLPVGTVRSRLHRARAALQEWLAPWWSEKGASELNAEEVAGSPAAHVASAEAASD